MWQFVSQEGEPDDDRLAVDPQRGWFQSTIAPISGGQGGMGALDFLA
jgi:hypothetical protein